MNWADAAPLVELAIGRKVQPPKIDMALKVMAHMFCNKLFDLIAFILGILPALVG